MKAADSAAGRVVKCPACGLKMRIVRPKSERPPVEDYGDVEDYGSDDELSEFANLPLDEFKDYGPVRSKSGRRKPCPMCGEPIRVKARKCRYCGENLVKKEKSYQARRDWHHNPTLQGTSESLTGGDILFAVLCTNIGCFMGLYWTMTGESKGWKMLLLCIALQIFWVIVYFGFRMQVR